MTSQNTIDTIAARYGVGSFIAPGERPEFSVDMKDPRLAQITRTKFINDPGSYRFDLSYCWGVLNDGTKVRVNLADYMQDWAMIPKGKINSSLYRACVNAGVNGKRLGIYNSVTTAE